ncbi:MAG TPA: hypothetical protein VNK95_13225 [Caldilineaceae bacterium]|nr:hypothetical protein [Caldilineaceae bacterium]
MSVHHESLDMARPIERTQEPPELEYTTVRNDSLAMFGAAIGGAVLGMLLTLLVLAVINGGTLSFTGGERLDILEASVARIDENVGAVSYNVDVVAEQARTIQTQLATVETNLRAELARSGEDVAALQQAVSDLDRASDQFTLFLTALEDALSQATQALDEAPAAAE